jgi:DNA-binding Lrp family transcriptional regulator
MEKLDEIDRKLLYELDLNARQPVSAISRKLGKSKETVNFRLRRLVKSGVVSNFYTVFDAARMGKYYFKLYLKFKSSAPEKQEEILEYLKGLKSVVYLASVEGTYDCVFLVMVRNAVDILQALDPFMKKYGKYVLEKETVVIICEHRLNQRFLYAGKERTDRKFSLEPREYYSDEADIAVMRAVAQDARATISEIAKKTGLTPSVVGYRLRKLQDDGVIIGYAATLNYAKLGLQFVQLNITLSDLSAKKKILAYFAATDRCLFALEIVGKYDLVVEVFVESQQELQAIVDGFRRKFADAYHEYDISTITKEHLVMWLPFERA